jgi:pseudouridine-5'-phosphate glycosidase/pseudouridine kinase
VRQNGAVPATIGVLDGVAQVGMLPADIAKLAATAGQVSTLKLSRRDLSYISGQVRSCLIHKMRLYTNSNPG